MRNSVLGITLFSATFLSAQPQLDNASFETWTDLGVATEEPGEWSSVKTSDGGSTINSFAPQMCWRSTEAHTGMYSVNLRTVNSLVGSATGLLTNGRVHAEFTIANSYVFTDGANNEWNTECGSRPDSLIGWYKATPEVGDFARIGALMHVDAGKLPAFDTGANWVGTADWAASTGAVDTWTRFSMPFNYTDARTPEHILLVMTAGDGANSIIGTQAWFDDMALIYNVYAVPDATVAFVTASQGFALNVAYTTAGIPNAATDFIVEMSDNTGSFASPVVLGSVNSIAAAGNIASLIPAGTLPGTYSIRVNTPSPYYVPVETEVVVELSTGISSHAFQNGRIRNNANGFIVDLQGTGFKNSGYEMIDARGAVVARGSLRNDAMNTIEMDGAQGIFLVRVFHSEGALVGRVFVQ